MLQTTSNLSALRAENGSQQRMLEDTISRCPAKKKQTSKKNTLIEIGLQHIEAAPVILKSLNVFRACEIRELFPLHPSYQRQWECRASYVESHGVLVASNSIVSHHPGDSIISWLEDYTPFFDGEQISFNFFFQ